MYSIKLFFGLSLAAALILKCYSSLWAADTAELFREKKCTICHGIDANSPMAQDYPKLAGQNKEYTMQQIKDIQSGKRTNGQSALMKSMMKPVREAEIALIAEWLGTLIRAPQKSDTHH